MDWMEQPVVIDAAAAATIAAGMRAVARADGDVHPRELALIASFERQIPAVHAARSMDDPDVRRTYLRSLLLVALADGEISQAEQQVILTLAAAQGFEPEEVEVETLSVKRRFLATFAGVSVFRDAVHGVARQLGLGPEEVDALTGRS